MPHRQFCGMEGGRALSRQRAVDYFEEIAGGPAAPPVILLRLRVRQHCQALVASRGQSSRRVCAECNGLGVSQNEGRGEQIGGFDGGDERTIGSAVDTICAKTIC